MTPGCAGPPRSRPRSPTSNDSGCSAGTASPSGSTPPSPGTPLHTNGGRRSVQHTISSRKREGRGGRTSKVHTDENAHPRAVMMMKRSVQNLRPRKTHCQLSRPTEFEIGVTTYMDSFRWCVCPLTPSMPSERRGALNRTRNITRMT